MQSGARCIIVILTFLSVGTTVAFLPTRIFPSRIIVSTATDNSLSFSREELDRDGHVWILDENLVRHTGKSLRDYTGGAEVQTSMRYALMSHGAVNDLDGATNNYANFAALSAFQMTFKQLTAMPAGRVANPGLDQEEWSQVLQKIRQMGKEGILQNYKGFRCTVNQTPFFLRDAVVRGHVGANPVDRRQIQLTSQVGLELL